MSENEWRRQRERPVVVRTHYLTPAERKWTERAALHASWLAAQDRAPAGDRRIRKLALVAGLLLAFALLASLVALIISVGAWGFGALVAVVVLVTCARPARTIEVVQQVIIRR